MKLLTLARSHESQKSEYCHITHTVERDTYYVADIISIIIEDQLFFGLMFYLLRDLLNV